MNGVEMTQKLQQAIQLARSGDKQKAQYLLAQTLQEEPENAQAWYLLSLLVDSESKQTAYLQRVLALDPTHEKAQARLAELTPAIVIAEPDWFEEEEPEEEVDWFAATAVAEPAKPAESAADLPDWLYEDEDEGENGDEEPDMADDGAEPAEATPVEAKATAVAAPPPAPAQSKPQAKGQDAQLTAVLIILIILAVVVALFLIYLLTTL